MMFLIKEKDGVCKIFLTGSWSEQSFSFVGVKVVMGEERVVVVVVRGQEGREECEGSGWAAAVGWRGNQFETRGWAHHSLFILWKKNLYRFLKKNLQFIIDYKCWISSYFVYTLFLEVLPLPKHQLIFLPTFYLDISHSSASLCASIVLIPAQFEKDYFLQPSCCTADT